MLFTPFNFVFSLQRVAVYDWEPAQPADDAVPPPAAACDDAAPPPGNPQNPSQPPLKLVFKGYEWASVANCSLFPRPSLEDCYTAVPDAAATDADSAEKERRGRQSESTRRPKPAAGPEQLNPPDASGPAGAPFDPLKSRQL